MTSAEFRDAEAMVADNPALAVARLRQILAADPLNASGYRLLAKALEGASRQLGHIRAIPPQPGASASLDQAEKAMDAGNPQQAEIIVRTELLERPTNSAALIMLAQRAFLLRFESQAEELLRLATEFDPDCAARIELARQLNRRDRGVEALEELDTVFERNPNDLVAKIVKASTLGRLGRYDEAANVYEEVLAVVADDPAIWATYGHLLKTMGRTDEATTALRHATRLAPEEGSAWSNLSNLKTVPFSAEEIETMEKVLGTSRPSALSRSEIHFALGKAYEDGRRFGDAFAQYEQANSIRAAMSPYDPRALAAKVDSSIKTNSPAFFEARTGWGAKARDPFFIVGLPRAGSTLIEQIVASHSEVEGTRELLHLPSVAGKLEGAGIDTIARETAAEAGNEYLRLSASHRLTDRPFFIDKLPGNWLWTGIIHLILPNAKIIDARRHPLACGFSNFKQSFSAGQEFSFDLSHIGKYYRQYVRFMAHIDGVLPGRIHRVFHERLIDDPEAEIRCLLEYLELPFEASCLRFYENERAVRTPSAEQVRRPIDRSSGEQWRKFEPYLGPLKDALGPVLDAYPEVPREPASPSSSGAG